MNKFAKAILKKIVLLFDSTSRANYFNQKKLICLIRLDAIGDFIIWLDSAKEYRRIYPGKKITLIANATWAEVAHGLPYWDEVLPVDLRKMTRNPLYRWHLLRKVSLAGFDVAIQPTFSRVLLHGDSIIRASGATERIGSVGNLSNISVQDKVISDHWYTQLLPANIEPMMELERNAEFITNLSLTPYTASLPKIPALKSLPEWLRQSDDYFIIFPGASWNGRQWPAANFAAVLEHLYQNHGWQPILCGALAERELCARVATLTGTPCLNLAGQTSLTEFAELVRGARLLIGNETSAVHISAAVGTPSVCILGGGHYGRFMPYTETIKGHKPLIAIHEMPCFNCNWQCNQPHDSTGPVPCISGVTVEDILEQVILAVGK